MPVVMPPRKWRRRNGKEEPSGGWLLRGAVRLRDKYSNFIRKQTTRSASNERREPATRSPDAAATNNPNDRGRQALLLLRLGFSVSGCCKHRSKHDGCDDDDAALVPGALRFRAFEGLGLTRLGRFALVHLAVRGIECPSVRQRQATRSARPRPMKRPELPSSLLLFSCSGQPISPVPRHDRHFLLTLINVFDAMTDGSGLKGHAQWTIIVDGC